MNAPTRRFVEAFEALASAAVTLAQSAALAAPAFVRFVQIVDESGGLPVIVRQDMHGAPLHIYDESRE